MMGDVAAADEADDEAEGLGGLLGGGGGGGAPPVGPLVLPPPVGKVLHPGFKNETAQALLALGRSLETQVADTQIGVIIPLSIAQQDMMVKVLFMVAWPGSEDSPAGFAARVKMWQDLDVFNLRAVQLFAVEAIETGGKIAEADVTAHMKLCMSTLMSVRDFDIDARRRDLLALRNTTDVVEALKVFLGGKYIKIAASMYKMLCDDATAYEGLRSMGVHVKTDDDNMQANFFSIVLGKLITGGLVTEAHCRMEFATDADAWEATVDCKTQFLLHIFESVQKFYSGTPAQILVAAAQALLDLGLGAHPGGPLFVEGFEDEWLIRRFSRAVLQAVSSSVDAVEHTRQLLLATERIRIVAGERIDQAVMRAELADVQNFDLTTEMGRVNACRTRLCPDASESTTGVGEVDDERWRRMAKLPFSRPDEVPISQNHTNQQIPAKLDTIKIAPDVPLAQAPYTVYTPLPPETHFEGEFPMPPDLFTEGVWDRIVGMSAAIQVELQRIII